MNNIPELIQRLNEIKMVHSSLNSIHLKDLKDIDQFMERLLKENKYDEIKKILFDFVEKNKKFHLAHYFLAILNYLNGQPGDEYLKDFFQELRSLGKNNLITIASYNILDHYESIYVMNCLVEELERVDEREGLIEILKKIFRLNPKNLAVSKKIAQYYEQSDLAESINYYQMSFFKAFELSYDKEMIELWKKLISLHPEDHRFYLNWCKKLAFKISRHKEVVFTTLIKNHEKTETVDHDYLIHLFKLAFESGLRLTPYYKHLLQSYKTKYQNHHYWDYFLKITSLGDLLTGKVVFNHHQTLSIINDFEKKIQFDVGKIVKHRSFGIGLIKEITSSDLKGRKSIDDIKLIIDFEKNTHHQMSFRIASNSLVMIDADHLVGLKRFQPERYQSILDGDSTQLLRLVLKSINKPVTQKDVYLFLEAEIFDEPTLKKRWSSLKKLLQNDDEFEIENKHYRIKDQNVSFEDIFMEKLKKTSIIKNQIKIIDFYFSNHSHRLKNNRTLKMIEKEILQPTPNNLIKHYMVYYFHRLFDIELDLKLEKLSYSMEDIELGYDLAISHTMKLNYLDYLVSHLKVDFREVILHLLKKDQVKEKELILNFALKNFPKLVEEIFTEIDKSYLNSPELYVLLARICFFENASISVHSDYEVILKLIKLFVECHRHIEHEKEVGYYKKVFLLIQKTFFGDQLLKTKLNLSDQSLSLEEKKNVAGQLIKLNFLENYIRIEILQLQEKILS